MMMNELIGIVKQASSLMLTDGFDILEKDGVTNIVTSSDVAVQEFLKTKLSQLLPGCGFLCEEEDKHRLGKEYTWIIDPIDGTANYSRGIDQCAICVGLQHNKDMEMSVVYLPRTNELFSAEKGKGAFLNGKPIHVSKRPFSNSLFCTALAVYHKEAAQLCSDIIIDTFMQCNDLRRFGAAAPELCYLAMGRCELYFEYCLSPWDYAAASLILMEAGGVISNLHADFPSLSEPSGILAANNAQNLAKLQSIVDKHLK
ncbi:MAG: inositol monophosphatase [Bacteroidaceae bacterium]|nr:inositol monophosphatase [Bacteroidaceae bacterium]